MYYRQYGSYAEDGPTRLVTLSGGTHKVSVYAAGQDNSLQRKDYTITVK